LDIESIYRQQIIAKVDSLVQRGLQTTAFGTIEDLRGILGEDGLFKRPDCYKPAAWAALAVPKPSKLGSDQNIPFSGLPFYTYMTQVALSGPFSIQTNFHGLPSSVQRPPDSSAALCSYVFKCGHLRIPMFAPAAGMILVTLNMIS
jgi:hypothetical protein